MRRVRYAIIFIVIALLITTPIKYFVAQPFVVSGASMEPTLDPHEYLIIDEISYYFQEPRRGELAIFRYPLDPELYFVKRIIALPGEMVEIKDGLVTITTLDGESMVLEEPYTMPGSAMHDMRKLQLSDEEYFMLGDNRSESSDSRKWGPLTRRFIVGRVFMRLYPFNEIKLRPGDHVFGEKTS